MSELSKTEKNCIRLHSAKFSSHSSSWATRHLLINHITCCKSMLRLFFYRSFTRFEPAKCKNTKKTFIFFFHRTSNRKLNIYFTRKNIRIQAIVPTITISQFTVSYPPQHFHEFHEQFSFIVSSRVSTEQEECAPTTKFFGSENAPTHDSTGRKKL